jgi:hypothetical protein
VLYFSATTGLCYGREIFKLGANGPEMIADLSSFVNGNNPYPPLDTFVSGWASLNGLL